MVLDDAEALGGIHVRGDLAEDVERALHVHPRGVGEQEEEGDHDAHPNRMGGDEVADFTPVDKPFPDALFGQTAVEGPEEVFAEELQQGRGKAQRGEQGDENAQGFGRAVGAGHAEIRHHHAQQADDDRGRAGGDDRPDLGHGADHGLAPVLGLGHFLPEAGDEEEGVVRAHAEDEHDDHGVQHGGEPGTGLGRETQNAPGDQVSRGDADEGHQRGYRGAVHQEKHEDDQDDGRQGGLVHALQGDLEHVPTHAGRTGQVDFQVLGGRAFDVLFNGRDGLIGARVVIGRGEGDGHEHGLVVLADEHVLEFRPVENGRHLVHVVRGLVGFEPLSHLPRVLQVRVGKAVGVVEDENTLARGHLVGELLLEDLLGLQVAGIRGKEHALVHDPDLGQ